MQRRRLTVSRTRPESRARVPRRFPAPMPFLRLKGRWLGEAGFAIGVPVQVTVAPGLLVLEALDDERGR
jgi:toxic protein SymE